MWKTEMIPFYYQPVCPDDMFDFGFFFSKRFTMTRCKMGFFPSFLSFILFWCWLVGWKSRKKKKTTQNNNNINDLPNFICSGVRSSNRFSFYHLSFAFICYPKTQNKNLTTLLILVTLHFSQRRPPHIKQITTNSTLFVSVSISLFSFFGFLFANKSSIENLNRRENAKESASLYLYV